MEKSRFIALLCISLALGAKEPLRPLPVEEPSSGTFFRGEFLYWKPDMDGLNYVTEVPKPKPIKPNEPKPLQTPQTPPKEVEGSWEPGFRATIGHIFERSGWDIAFAWTHFRNASASSFNGPGIPTALSSSKARSTHASGQWRLIQNVIDIEAGRRVPVGEQFFARGFFGVRDAILHNRTLFQYLLTEPSLLSVESWSKYWGLGPRIGGSAAYEFGYGIGLFALGSGAVLMGDRHSTLNGKTIENNSWVNMVTTLQIEAGVQWQRVLFNRLHTAFRLSWEQNFYSGASLSVAQTERITHDSRLVQQYQETGDLLTRGWTASCQMQY